MCGIAGIYQPDERPVDGQVLSRMLTSLRHRGPDDEGTWVDRGIGVGTRRLSIIDLPGGRQPILNEDGSVVVVQNGEIYNYRELRQRLAGSGHRFTTSSDTEVIVHLYEELGDACVDELRGMFGFAIWDRRRKRLLVVRDRLGIKPMYYAEVNGALVFGSEIKALLQYPALTAAPNLDAIGNYLSLKYVPAPQTMFEGVAALPPGHLLVRDAEGLTVRRYWDVTFTSDREPAQRDETYIERLDVLLRDSVRAHLISDVPFGAFLSGGLDSSTIVALMSRELSEPVKTFSVGFEGEGAKLSELPFARQVAEHCATEHHEVIVSGHHLVDGAEKVVWHLDQPIADPACLANYLVAELAARHVKMVLTGEGGDELFAGYARYAGERLAPVFRHVPSALKSVLRSGAQHVPGLRRAKLALHALSQPNDLKRLVNWFPLFNEAQKVDLLSAEAAAALSSTAPDEVFASCLAGTDATDPLSRMLYVDTKLWLPDDLLARGDKTSMAASIEARVPLLDHTLVEFAATLPSHLKLRGLTRKYILKQVARKWLPESIIFRKKQGFPIPLGAWFRNDARELLRDVLSPAAIRRRGLLNPTAVSRLITANDAGADHGSALWALLSLELWHRLFIDSAPSLGPVRTHASSTTAPAGPVAIGVAAGRKEAAGAAG